jgi:hypothetical protein
LHWVPNQLELVPQSWSTLLWVRSTLNPVPALKPAVAATAVLHPCARHIPTALCISTTGAAKSLAALISNAALLF